MHSRRSQEVAAKVIAIGLDSADRRLVDQWCDSGDLPVLRGIRERGVSGPVDSPPGLADDGAWASFSTAVSPGRHGRYFWHYPDPATYERHLWGDEVTVEPFWSSLSKAGRRVAVIDVPKCPLVPELNGIQVADWLVHGRDHQETCSWPPELAPGLVSRFGEDRTDRVHQDWMCLLHALPEADFPAFRGFLLDGISQKTRFASELLEQGGWDLFLVVFKEAHCVGHQCWRRLTQPGDGAGPVKEIYRALDQAIGELIAFAGEQTSVIVFSDIGMGPNHTGEHLLDGILARLEPKLVTARQRARLTGARIHRRLKAAWGKRDVRHPLSDRLAYQLEHNEMSGAIRINVVGREPAGTVMPGREYADLCQALTRELRELRNPVTGQPLVETVLTSDRAFPGAHRDRLPDLFVVWNREAPITGATSAALGRLDAAEPKYRPGNHVAGGFFASVGSAVVPGRRAEAVSIMDFAPTIATLLNVKLEGREGKPIFGIC